MEKPGEAAAAAKVAAKEKEIPMTLNAKNNAELYDRMMNILETQIKV